MGDPKKLRKQYKTPSHPWNAKAIEEEKVLVKEYGLGKKKEIYIADSFLKKYKDIAKKLISDKTNQGEKEKEQMMKKLRGLGLLDMTAELDDVLSLQLKDILERRIQSLLFRKGLAKSIKQARQFITHEHIKLGNKSITSPGYLTTIEEEANLNFSENSAFIDEEHPERVSAAQQVAEEMGKVNNMKKEEAPAKSEVKVDTTTEGTSPNAEEVTDDKEEKSDVTKEEKADTTEDTKDPKEVNKEVKAE